MSAGMMIAAAGLANVLWAALLVVGAVVSMGDGPGLAIPDWLAHALGYGVQAGLVWGLLVVVGRGRPVSPVWPVAAAIGLGTITELLQTMRPERSAELRDLVADALGALVVVLALQACRRRLRSDGAEGLE